MIDSKDFQMLASEVKVKWGKGRFSLDYFLVGDAEYDEIVEAREVDPRLHSVGDGLGNIFMYYVHGLDYIKIVPVGYLEKIQLVTSLGSRFPKSERT